MVAKQFETDKWDKLSGDELLAKMGLVLLAFIGGGGIIDLQVPRKNVEGAASLASKMKRVPVRIRTNAAGDVQVSMKPLNLKRVK